MVPILDPASSFYLLLRPPKARATSCSALSICLILGFIAIVILLLLLIGSVWSCAEERSDVRAEKPKDGDGEKEMAWVHWHGVNRLNTAWGWMS